MLKQVNIIGVGPAGLNSLTPETFSVIFSSDLIIGWERTLPLFRGIPIVKMLIKSNLPEMVSVINSSPEKTISVLASGDPNFFGISEYLYKKIDKNRIKVFPNVSSMQLAFAAAKESMNEAEIVSVHGRGLDKLLKVLKYSSKVGIFTDKTNSPSKIASWLIHRGVADIEVYLCENMGKESESVRRMNLETLAGTKCADLNILLLIKRNPKTLKKYQFGIPDKDFLTRNRMITKEEVRVVSLSKLRLFSGATFWDIGAGSGSVSIEAGFLVEGGQVYAIEKEPDAVTIINKNIERFSLGNVNVLNTTAPEGLEELPAPDAVFIGGSGGNLTRVILHCFRRLRDGGRIVMNTLVLENLNEAILTFKEQGVTPEVVQVSISKEKQAGRLKILAGQNPVFILSVVKVVQNPIKADCQEDRTSNSR